MGHTAEFISNDLIKGLVLLDIVVELALRFPLVLFIVAVHTHIVQTAVPYMCIRRRYQEPRICAVPTPKTAVMTGTSFHKEESVGIVVDVVKRVACAGIPAVIHDEEACFLVIVLRIKHTVAVCDAEIAVIVLILR